MSSQALVPLLLEKNSLTRFWERLLIVAGGLLALTALANLQIHLPFTPVPITGQTFGVTLLALLFGRKLSALTVVTYVGLGIAGVPLLAIASPVTYGYLLGMVLSSIVVGRLADRGWTQTWLRAYAASALGSICVFALGLAVLSFYVPTASLVSLGLLPFLPGDLLKDALASTIAVVSRRQFVR